MSWRVLITVAVFSAIVGWFIFRAASHGAALDADRPGVDLGVSYASTSTEVSSQLRDALTEGRSVRVEYDGTAEREPLVRQFWCRKLSDSEAARATRTLTRLIQQKTEALASRPPIEGSAEEQYRREATLQKHLALQRAALALVSAGRCFLTKSLIGELKSDGEWHYWTLRFKGDDKVDYVLYAPIHLPERPDVTISIARASDISEYLLIEKASAWNELDFASRRARVEAATVARARYEEVTRLLDEKVRRGDAVAEFEPLRREMLALEETISAVPRRYDVDTLECILR